MLVLSFCLSLDDLPVIESDSDLDQSGKDGEDVEKDSGQQISDCGSDSADENRTCCPLNAANVSLLYFCK